GVERAIVPPAQYGPPFVGAGVAAALLTTTLGEPGAGVEPGGVTTMDEVPAFAAVALLIVGFCTDAVKLFGPVQAYVAPLTAGVDSAMVSPAQYGPALLATAGPAV